MYVFGDSILNGALTANSSMYISGESILNNALTANSSMYISGESILNNALTANSSLYVSGDSTLNGKLNFIFKSSNIFNDNPTEYFTTTSMINFISHNSDLTIHTLTTDLPSNSEIITICNSSINSIYITTPSCIIGPNEYIQFLYNNNIWYKPAKEI